MVPIADSSPLRQLQSPIFNLIVDCFEELFDRLSIEELLTLRTVCKQMKQVVDYYIREYLPGVKFGSLEINDFKIFDVLEPNNIIKEIDCGGDFPIQPQMIVDIKDFLTNVEHVKIDVPVVNGEFHEVFLKYCNNLKRLQVDFDGFVIAGTGNDWLLRRYPQLEHIVLYDGNTPSGGREITELKTFFHLNPNIRTLSTTFRILWRNRNWIIGSNIKFDRLDLECDYLQNEMGINYLSLLNELHKQGLYQRLHLFTYDISLQEDFDQILSSKSLEKLHLFDINKDLVVPAPVDVRELHFGCEADVQNLPANNFIHLKRLRVLGVSFTDIMPYIRQLKRLTEIIIEDLEEDDYCTNGVVRLLSLNKKRKQLSFAKKIIIYVDEEIFLKTKWANEHTSFPLIELDRFQSLERGFQFL